MYFFSPFENIRNCYSRPKSQPTHFYTNPGTHESFSSTCGQAVFGRTDVSAAPDTMWPVSPDNIKLPVVLTKAKLGN
ncbi:hypothetical protein A8V23_08385 [Yersinia pestis]|uniref:Uncharacterized protein n=1 Tax=Yersinia pestis TaxID=632 RepID=Q74UU2_YERPE|nr:hypothetical protein BAY22_07790 [Yersinia pestis]EDM42751.1 hypothetical protein YPE_1474 [Yersinia pestis CA88-4125]EKS46186.1 hypothetical protein INS_09307 [Yersinia pestis INS]KJG83306.1 hypothetical protein RN24_19540 [Yersinia pestis subsp. microtus bv. Ulegeica]KKM52624.1 hypothetical protein KD37_05425 [Yersinia pestis subsp. pestis bv. Orientalis]KPD45319.1 hypothetical protein AC472_07500 [Yersinia pestis subsp. microtus bv. Caucasica]KPD54480.1 hypothetical protein AC596_11120 